MDEKEQDLTCEEIAELEEALYRSIHYGEHNNDAIIITPLDMKLEQQIKSEDTTNENNEIILCKNSTDANKTTEAHNLTNATDAQHLPTALTTTSKSSTTTAAKSYKATTTSTTSTKTSTTSEALQINTVSLGKRVQNINTLRDITQTALRKKGLRLNPRTSLVVAKKIAAGECALDTNKTNKLQKKLAKNAKSAQSRKKLPVVDLLQSDSDENEVVIIPNPPSPIISIMDTDDEDNNESHKLARCASPGSVMSSDDFIESEDRARLKQETEVPPNDQDILDMTAEIANTVNSHEKSNKVAAETAETPAMKETTLNVVVEETADFRSMDVYDESETDNREVDNRPATKHITISDGTDSDSDASVVEVPIDKVKRLRKRRHPEAAIIRLNTTVNLETPVPYISRGPAVPESYQSERKRTTSVNSNPMSDKTFINTLNNLAQGRQNSNSENVNDSEDDSDMENTLTARQIAEQALESRKKSIEKNMEVPDFLASLKQSFVCIDAYCSADEAEDQSKQNESTKKGMSGEEDQLTCGEDESPVKIRREITHHRHVPDYCNDGHGWSNEMARFYNDSWQGNNQSLNDILKKVKQQGKKSNWNIHIKDYTPFTNRRRDLKCHNCSEFGHTRVKCKLPRKPLICFMCGEQGHSEPRCPNTICLNCGKKSEYFTRKCTNCVNWNKRPCVICNRHGHVHTMCPDVWRRFRHTTEGGSEPVKGYRDLPKKKYCSACAGCGHYVDECLQAKRVLDYLPVSTKVFEYHDPYPRSQRAGCRVHLSYSLLYDPNVLPEFTMSKKTTPHKYYGRFLKAVGMSDSLCNNKKQQEQKETPKKEMSINLNIINEDGPADDKFVKAVAEALDSDSNYSFSENFPIVENQTTTGGGGIKFKDDLPEFIPFTDNKSNVEEEKKHVQNTNNNNNSFIAFIKNDGKEKQHVLKGISKNFMPQEEQKPQEEQEVKESKTVAKIYLNEQTAQFLTSDVGKRFLEENMKNCQVTTKIIETNLGRVIEVFGLEKQQENFQTKLQARVVELMVDSHRQRVENLQNVPKRVDSMILFLRNALNQLYQRLGNVQDLYKRQQISEQRPTKASLRTADKARRLLNMILVGQGGLLNGKSHVEHLLEYLKELLRSKGTQFVQTDMRMRIGNIFKLIFTPYRHDNYDDLLQQFSQLTTKNQLIDMNIDAMLLGRSVIKKNDTSAEMPAIQVSKPQVATKRKLSSEGQPAAKIKNEQIALYVPPHLQQQQQQQQQSKTKALKARIIAPPAHHKAEMLGKPCVFWSKESIQYLKSCLEVTDPISNVTLHDQLERVLDKARRCLLSYNDYRAVIKLHTSITEDVAND